MTKVSDFPDGYDVEEFIKGCESIWHKPLNLPKEIPAFKIIGGIKHRLYTWTETKDVHLIEKDLNTIKECTKAKHIASIKLQKKYQCVYIA